MNEEWEEILTSMQNKDADYKEFEIWLENGIERGWITEPFCNTHDGDPYMTEEEQEYACSVCGTKLRRVYTAPPVKFNGSGFYSTGG